MGVDDLEALGSLDKEQKIDKELDRIAGHVTGAKVHGKFPAGTKIGEDGYDGYEGTYGSWTVRGQNIPDTLDAGIVRERRKMSMRGTEGVWYVQANSRRKEGDVLIGIFGIQEPNEWFNPIHSNRETSTQSQVEFMITMPTQDYRDLQDVLRSNKREAPLRIFNFVNRVFPGLIVGNSGDRPGIRVDEPRELA